MPGGLKSELEVNCRLECLNDLGEFFNMARGDVSGLGPVTDHLFRFIAKNQAESPPGAVFAEVQSAVIQVESALHGRLNIPVEFGFFLTVINRTQ